MAFMNKMRDSMPVVFAGLAGVFLLMIIFEWGGQGMIFRKTGGFDGENIGIVDGRKISIKEYNQEVEFATENEKQQQKKTELNEADVAKLENQSWENLITRALIKNNAEKLGIVVTDQEIRDELFENPPPVARHQFTDSLGTFHEKEYFEALRNPKNDSVVYRYLVAPAREQLLLRKWNYLMTASIRITDAELWDRFQVDNSKATVDVVRIYPKRPAREYMSQVTDADVKAYYDAHQFMYKSDETRKVKFVIFPEKPSPKDSLQALDRVTDIKDRLAKTPEADLDSVVKELTEEYSSQPYQPSQILNPSKWGAMPIAATLSSAKAGDVFSDATPMQATVYRVVSIIDTSAMFFHPRHILIGFGKKGHENKDSAKVIADKVYDELKAGGNFGDLARKYSTDPGSTKSGGDLKWVGPGMFVKEVDAVCQKAPLNEIQPPVASDFGYHIIEVLDRTNKNIKVVSVPIDIKPSSQTLRMIQQQAQIFHDQAEKNGFDQAAKMEGLQVITNAPSIQKKGQQLFNDKDFNEWAFAASKGDISIPVRVSQTHLTCVAQLTDIIPAGVKPIEEVKEQIKQEVAGKKRIEALAADAQRYRAMIGPGDDLSKIAAATGDTTLKPVTLTMGPAESVPGLNTEYVVNNAAFNSLKPGEISPAMKGDNGWYIVRLDSKNLATKEMLASQKVSLIQKMQQEKSQRFLTAWINDAKDKAKIEDYRSKK